MLIYDRANVIEQLDRRNSDPAGDREHKETVIEQEIVEKIEKSRDLKPRQVEKK